LEVNVVYRRHNHVNWNLPMKCVKGVGSWRGLHPQPLLPLENVDPPPKTWIALKKCSFCGLRFSLVWVVWFASCKHFSHDWCAMYHFGTFIKCIQRGCEDEMHKSWWSVTGFKKLGSSILVKDEGKCTMKVERPWAVIEVPLWVPFIQCIMF
jgi:hypothetical protein